MKRLLTISFLFIVLDLQGQSWCHAHLKVNQGKLSQSSRISEASSFNLGVIIHLVENDPAISSISDEEIQRILHLVNSDLNASNSDLSQVDQEFKSLVSATGISIGLPSAISNPIRRTASNHLPFGSKDIYESSKGGSDPVQGEKYLNIWVSDLAEGILGWSSTPGDDSFPTGIVLDYTVFTDQGRAYRTLIHELGHFLGLQHLEGNQKSCEVNDGIQDTPAQNEPVYACSESAYQCGAKSMTRNFMNQGAGDCMLFFTKGQVEAMHKAFETQYIDFDQNIIAPNLITAIGDQQNSTFDFGPNPFSQHVQFAGAIKDQNISWYNQLGKEIEVPFKSTDSKTIFQTSKLPKGQYFLKVMHSNRSQTLKLVKYE